MNDSGLLVKLGYRGGNSPFPINADLLFCLPIPVVPTIGAGEFPVDESGNPVASVEWVQYGCYLMTSARGQIKEQVPGADFDRVFLRGRVIERVIPAVAPLVGVTRLSSATFDPRIRSGLVAEAVIYPAELPSAMGVPDVTVTGKMQIDIPIQSPWIPVRSSLGDRFSGYFQQESVSGNGQN